jgi:hypothetical protein
LAGGDPSGLLLPATRQGGVWCLRDFVC